MPFEMLDNQHLEVDKIKQYKDSFLNAKPYKHLVIDNFLKSDIAQALYSKFPAYEIFNKKYDGLNERKAEGSNFEDFDPLFSKLRAEVSSPEFCKFISEITDIKDVFVTNDALGAGLHQGKSGSFLDIHIDFSMHHIANVYRRLNLLIFFNKDWQDAWGGHTELWNEDMTQCIKKVKPDFNRALIFATTGKSYHGYGKISPPEGVTRKSFYTYYYTHTAGEQDGTYHDTIFKTRPEEGTTKKIKTNLKETFKNSIKKALKAIGVKF
jgi:Rps23 Pro-64 3,4-dihydroxylase Tpa1-like proline 4-hydroxylase